MKRRQFLEMLGWSSACFLLGKNPVQALSIGAKAPEIGLPILANGSGKIEISRLRGQVLIVDFWASWCKPCAEAMPHLDRLFTSYSDRGLRVIGVSQDESEAGVRMFLRRVRVSFPVVLDATHEVAGRYGPSHMPTTFFVDRKGSIRYIHTGFRAQDVPLFTSRVMSLLGES
ncbi:MAG: TlpA family protein disulfide reductase [Sandaracinaceae bacterium]|nr:TlpA family protein disulfide reductase [Sandaracinaceae bacterium]